MTAISGYYLSDFDPYDLGHVQTGIDRKIISQIDTFNEAGLNCKSIVAVRPKSAIVKGLASLPCFPDFIDWPDATSLIGASYLYIRRPVFSTRGFISFLDAFRKCNPKAKVLIELPTYPYDAEFDSPELFFALRKDRRYRQKWKFYIDRIIDMSDLPEVFGVKTVHFFNGINLKEYSIRQPSHHSSAALEILFPASFAAYQGCDLLIRGLANYYHDGGKRNIVLHLAGVGPEIPALRKLVTEGQLEDHVTFHGMLTMDELSILYDRCSFGVASLGMHRRSTNLVSGAIKTREFLAKGLPFVYAGSIDVFNANPVDFCLQVESKETPIDINKIVDFYDRLYENESEASLIQRIRHYAEDNISMSVAMSNVIEFIKE